MATAIVIRSGRDRLRYALLFEGILVVSFGLVLATLTDRSPLDTGGLALVLSLIALVVNLAYNYLFDRADVRNGRVPTERSRTWRIVHALGFEATLVVISLPVIMAWLDWGFLEALLFDITAMAAVVVYTFFFTLAYDRVFPIRQPA